MAVDLTAVSLPHYTAGASLSGTAEVLTVGTHVSEVYIYIDDAGGGLVAGDATNFGPIAGQTWERIYAAPAKGATRDATIQVKVSSGTPTRYYRAF